MSEKKEIVKQFAKYCSQCNGRCCKRGVVSVFEWESEMLSLEYECFQHCKIADKRGTAKDIAINKICMFSKKNGCKLPIDTRPADCLTYPFYPKLKKNNGDLKIDLFLIQKECSFYKKISKDKKLLKTVHIYWENMAKKITNQELIDWIGADGAWNEWYKNTIAVKNNHY